MPVKNFETSAPVAIGTSATVLDTAAVGEKRFHYGSVVANTNSSSSVEVRLYRSADSSAAAGEFLEKIVLGAEESQKVISLTLSGADAANLLGVANNTNAVFHPAYQRADGSDA